VRSIFITAGYFFYLTDLSLTHFLIYSLNLLHNPILFLINQSKKLLIRHSIVFCLLTLYCPLIDLLSFCGFRWIFSLLIPDVLLSLTNYKHLLCSKQTWLIIILIINGGTLTLYKQFSIQLMFLFNQCISILMVINQHIVIVSVCLFLYQQLWFILLS
jgi:hypothetical protein